MVWLANQVWFSWNWWCLTIALFLRISMPNYSGLILGVDLSCWFRRLSLMWYRPRLFAGTTRSVAEAAIARDSPKCDALMICQSNQNIRQLWIESSNIIFPSFFIVWSCGMSHHSFINDHLDCSLYYLIMTWFDMECFENAWIKIWNW